VSVLVLVEHDGARADLTSLETLALARGVADALGTFVDAVLFGMGGRSVAGSLAGQRVATAHVVESDRLDAYAPGAWAESLRQLQAAEGASVVMAAGTQRGNEVLAHLAARTGLAMAANCLAVEPGEPFRIARQRWAGSLIEDATLDGGIHLLTVAPHAVAAQEGEGDGSSPEIRAFSPELSETDLRVRVTRRVAPEATGVAIGSARVVIGGGRGVGSAEGFAELEELAGLLGGAVGVSRAVTSAGWRPHSEQVGQTGARIAPDVYIACGISGAIQHIVGCKSAKTIIAINKDAEAPIMGRADYAVIGDLHAILPAITAEIRRLR
jgi:electron transfer flavoprotein alpha subunit